MPKSVFTPSPSEIAEMMSHVRYEIEKAFVLPEHNENDPHLKEAVWLSAMIHARILLEFFEDTSRHKDTLMCSDFGFTAKSVTIPTDDRERFNKDMAHLTYRRLRHDKKTKPWPTDAILLPVRSRAIEFVKHVISQPPAGANALELDAWKRLLPLLEWKEGFPTIPTSHAYSASNVSFADGGGSVITVNLRIPSVDTSSLSGGASL